MSSNHFVLIQLGDTDTVAVSYLEQWEVKFIC